MIKTLTITIGDGKMYISRPAGMRAREVIHILKSALEMEKSGKGKRFRKGGRP